MKRIILTAASSVALFTSAPALAQDAQVSDEEMAELEEMMAGMGALFPREPLTPEQEERLPAAERIVTLMLPEGVMGDIMGGMIDDIFAPMMAMGPPASTQTVADGLGLEPSQLDLDEAAAAEIALLFDAAYEERRAVQFSVFPDVMREMMTAMEPGLRETMTELYAIKFSAKELADIEAFFSTETGMTYARESFAMASDPRIMSASMEALPAMMGALGDMEARIEAATADLPPTRSYADLTAQERDAIFKATGLAEKDILANLKLVEETEGGM